jgi:Protein of unknown function (DUF2892)
MFNSNVGGVNRVVRIIAGLGVLSLVFVGPQTPWGYVDVSWKEWSPKFR